MTDKKTIIETLAKDRRVEALVENIAHHSLTADLKDLRYSRTAKLIEV